MQCSHKIDRLAVAFDDDRALADAGLILPATLAQRLGLRELFDEHVELGEAPGRAHVGHKAMTLIHSALAGGECIDDANALRAGGTAAVLGHELRAPSTLGTFLRSFTWGHARQLDRVQGELLARAWRAGAGPGAESLTIDVDSTICETYGLQKHGARFGYTGVRGYHPLIASVAGTGELVGARLRGGNAHAGRGAAHFVTETVGRVRSAGASGPFTLRADSGFYAQAVVEACRQADVRYSITARLQAGLRDRIEAISEADWVPISYWREGFADVAETTYRPFGQERAVRLIVRRVRPTPGTQLALLVDYAYHPFITDREGELLELEADHRRHAEVENVVRDLKYSLGLNHLPSGRFGANAAWLAFNVIAYNLARWVARLGLQEGVLTARTLRRRLFTLPGRLTRSARRLTLHLPSRWPWRMGFLAALERLRALPSPLPI
jgi:hypothetical protein